MKSLLDKINSNTACVGVIGLGYVGLPLALVFSKKFQTIGFDVNEKCINLLNSGKSYILDIQDTDLQKYLNISFNPTNDPEKLRQCDFLIICVPTPLTEHMEPDLSYIKSACTTISRILTPGQFVILESTTYPGTTEEVVLNILQTSGLKVEKDFGLAYSPERIDPGNKSFNVENTPKVVGGISGECTEIAKVLYSSVIQKVMAVTDCKTAESVKIVENIFRNVNIALVNELALIFERMGINSWEVIDAASTKPYGFMPFYPGPGIGGHCIPLDPYYMSYQAKKYSFIPRFIETSGEINNFMRIHVINLIRKGLEITGKQIYGSKISILGISYKKNIDDIRESPAITIINELANLGAHVKIYDPYIEFICTKIGTYYSEKCIADSLENVDCAVFLVDHDVFDRIDPRYVERLQIPIIDCKNVFKNKLDSKIYLGLGKGQTISPK